MIQEFNDLKNKFLHIKNQGWIKSIRKGSTGSGVTFEYLLGLQENNLEIPDYEGIEIKTKRNYSNSYTTLFNCTPEGPHFREIERLVNKYGYPDLVLKECKVINNSIFTKRSEQNAIMELLKINCIKCLPSLFVINLTSAQETV